MAIQPIQAAPEWLTVRDAAEKVGVHTNTIRNKIATGELKASRIGLRIIRIAPSDLDALFTPVIGGEFGVWNR